MIRLADGSGGRRTVALVPVLAGLIVIAGPTVSASAQDTDCTVEAIGALPSGDAFHGDAAGEGS